MAWVPARKEPVIMAKASALIWEGKDMVVARVWVDVLEVWKVWLCAFDIEVNQSGVE